MQKSPRKRWTISRKLTVLTLLLQLPAAAIGFLSLKTIELLGETRGEVEEMAQQLIPLTTNCAEIVASLERRGMQVSKAVLASERSKGDNIAIFDDCEMVFREAGDELEESLGSLAKIATLVLLQSADRDEEDEVEEGIERSAAIHEGLTEIRNHFRAAEREGIAFFAHLRNSDSDRATDALTQLTHAEEQCLTAAMSLSHVADEEIDDTEEDSIWFEDRARSMTFWVGGIAIVLGILGMIHLALGLVRTLQTVSDGAHDAVERLLQDNVNIEPIPVRSSDEIGDLTQSLNQLIDRLATNIRERSLLQSDLVDARDSALEAAKAKSQFLANMSHEIRTPMNGVIGMCGLLLETDLNDDQKEYAEIVRNSGDAMLAVVNDILEFSRLDAGNIELEESEFDCLELVESTLDMFVENARTSRLELVSYVDPDLDVPLLGDVGRVRQVLLNLVGNAVKFTKQGEVAIHATRVKETDDGVQVRFEVKDTGIGIDPEDHERIFGAFAQEDASTTRKYGGTGLGLAICQQLVHLFGGEIGLESTPNVGSTFWFTLDFTRAIGRSPTLLPVDLNGMPVLIVDDNTTNRRILTQYLTNWGMSVESAEDGSGALSTLRAAAKTDRKIRMALLDFQMPGMDGVQLARAIKSDPNIADTDLILLTSVGQGELSNLRESGIVAHLTKPIHKARLLSSIQEAIQSEGIVPTRLAESDKIPAPASSPDHGGILVVEDNPANQRVIKNLLARLGVACDIVANGLEAVESVARKPYALILMDCQMPEMDGFEATRRIRELEGIEQPKIIAVTANAMPGDHERCESAGMDDYVTKPITLDRLRGVLEKWTSKVDSTGDSP